VADFGGRVIQSVNLTTLPKTHPGDVAGTARSLPGSRGPGSWLRGRFASSNIVSLDVMDDTGTARTSDVIAAAQWILANKDKYNIKVANFRCTRPTRAASRTIRSTRRREAVVQRRHGRRGGRQLRLPNGPSGVPYAPGNDPFVITVGAADMDGNPNPKDDTAPFWSAYGYTNDGFRKPEVAATGATWSVRFR